MDAWVRDGKAPPASQYPRLADGTLVAADAGGVPGDPGRGVAAQRSRPLGRATGRSPFLVPQVDADGNERAGVRAPEIAVPLATYTGWNFRERVDRRHRTCWSRSWARRFRLRGPRRSGGGGDPRRSIDERYPSHEAYLTQRVQSAADALVARGYLLARTMCRRCIERRMRRTHVSRA